MSGEPKSYRQHVEALRAKDASVSPAASATNNVAVIGTRQPAAEPGEDNAALAAVARRQQRPRLNFVFRNGKELSIAYIHLLPVELDGGELLLEYPWYSIRLKGRNLVKLKRRLDLQIHGTIREVDAMADAGAETPKPYAVYEITKVARKDGP